MLFVNTFLISSAKNIDFNMKLWYPFICRLGAFMMTAGQYMEIAIEQAELAKQKGEVPIGAVIVKDGQIISKGYNLRETNKNATSHAEIIAIEMACKKLDSWRLDDCSIYVTLEPCMMCAGAIIQSRIKNVYFGGFDKKAGAFGTVVDFATMNFTHKVNVYAGIMEEECSKILKDFFSELRKTK